MIAYPRGRRQLRGKDEGAPFGLRLAHPADIGPQATAELACVPQQTMGGVAFEVVPDLLRRIEFWGIRRELFQMQPGMGLAHRLDRGPAMNRTTIPEEHDMAAPMTQERAEEVGHIDRLEVARLPAQVQAQVLALRGDGEGGPRRDAVMLIVVGDDRRVSGRSPGAPAGGYEQKAALIQDGQMGAQPLAVFLWRATGSASNGRSPARRGGWPGAQAPDNSSPCRARSSRRAPDGSARQSGRESPPQYASRSTAR
jgi:hypothetical protein